MPRFDVFHKTALCGLQYLTTVDTPTAEGAKQRVAFEMGYLFSQLAANPAYDLRQLVKELPAKSEQTKVEGQE